MRRALGIAAGLALIGAALFPPPASAGCLTEARKCQGGPLIDIKLTAGTLPRTTGGGQVSYVLDYSMSWTPSFAPYWGAFWVGGRFPAGVKGPAKAVLLDTADRRVAVLRCREHSDGVWCAAGSHLPHRGKVVLTAALADQPGGKAVARLGFHSFEGLGRGDSERRLSRREARERFCEHRFTTTVTTTMDS